MRFFCLRVLLLLLAGMQIGTACLFAESLSAGSSLVPPPTLQSPTPPPQDDVIRVQVIEVETGQTAAVSSIKPTRTLIQKPEIAIVLETRPEGLIVRGEAIGETLLLVWSAEGVQSYRIRVIRSRKIEKRIKEVQTLNSRLYRSRQNRTFRFTYETAYEYLGSEQVLPRVTEARKFYNHDMTVRGSTPIGDLRGRLFYEYRKEPSMQKSVNKPRDFFISLENMKLPLVRQHDFTAGTQYLALDEYGLPGQRIWGLVIKPSENKPRVIKTRPTGLTAFVGLLRDGGLIDHPSSIQNRELPGKLVGHKFAVPVKDFGTFSLASFHQWGGRGERLKGRHNWTSQLDFEFPHFEFHSESGMDDKNRTAADVKALVKNDWASFEGRWYRVDKRYRTITGGARDRGRQGTELNTRLLPLMPFFESDALLIDATVEWARDRVSVNPEKPSGYINSQNIKARAKLPFDITHDASYLRENRMPTASPFTHHKFNQELSKSKSFNHPLLKRFGGYVGWTYERYRESLNIPGFNSTRTEIAAGASASLGYGFRISGKYAFNRLREEDPFTDPHAVTNPRQISVSGGWTHQFRKPRITLSLDAFLFDHGQTHGKIHQPFLNEDRVEFHGSLLWKILKDTELFVRARTTMTDSLVAGPDNAELFLTWGMRTALDTDFYIPQTGSIEGYVFKDSNGNGLREADEVGIMGFAVRADDGPKARSEPDGFYRLKVKEGAWRILGDDELPEGYYFTTANHRDVELLPQELVRMDIGMAPQIEVKGTVYLDINENGIFESVDKPIHGIQLVLDSGQAAVSTGRGTYSVLRMRPGPNRIRVVPESIPTGFRTLAAIEKNFDGSPGDVIHFDVPITAQRSVNGYVYVDENRDGKRQRSEQGLAKVELEINGQLIRTAKFGNYLGGLKVGKNTIRLIKRSLPSGFRPLIESQEVDIDAGPVVLYDVDFPVYGPLSQPGDPGADGPDPVS